MIVDKDKLINSLNELRNKGNQRGDLTGFNCLDKLYTFRQGYCTLLLGSSKSGKSEFAFEILINQAYKYKKRSLIYSPEMGTPAEIMAELIHKVYGKSIMKTQEVYLDITKFNEAINFCNHYFKIIDTEEHEYSLDDIFRYCVDFDKNESEKLYMIVAEPFNTLKNDLSSVFGSKDRYVEEFMKKMRVFCKKNNKHVILGLHPTDQDKKLKKDSDNYYYPMPYPREAMWGQTWDRMAFGFITMWRPPNWKDNPLTNPETGMPFKHNEVVIRVDKAKPKGIGDLGTISIFFDYKRNRYYEDIDGRTCYAFEHENILHHNGKIVFDIYAKTPSLNDLRNTQFDDIPF